MTAKVPLVVIGVPETLSPGGTDRATLVTVPLPPPPLGGTTHDLTPAAVEDSKYPSIEGLPKAGS